MIEITIPYQYKNIDGKMIDWEKVNATVKRYVSKSIDEALTIYSAINSDINIGITHNEEKQAVIVKIFIDSEGNEYYE